jgi:DNA primase
VSVGSDDRNASRAIWREWKARVRIVKVLEDIGRLAEFRVSGRRLIGPCPVHGGDNRRAFSIDHQRDLWFCFTRCQSGGDVIDLVWRLSGRSWPSTAAWLERLAASPMHACLSGGHPLPANPTDRPFHPFTRRLLLDPSHAFFRHLHIDEKTLRLFEAGSWYGPGFLQGTVAVRLHDLRGHPIGYAGRRLDPADIARWGKWKWPPGFPKSKLLWNWHRAVSDRDGGLVVVEGAWSVMKLWQAGFRNVVALGGAHISPDQAQLLRLATSVTLFFDGDPTGHRATARSLASAFHPRVRAIHPPEGLDPADLTEPHLRELLKRP